MKRSRVSRKNTFDVSDVTEGERKWRLSISA